jgi:uncharacterized protein YktA (UPF0223 family)
MKISVIFTSFFLSWVAFDPNIHRSSVATFSREAALYDEETKKQKLRKIYKRNRDVIPPKFRKRKVKLRSRCSYSGTKSKDHRDSDQRKIRRRFNNM